MMNFAIELFHKCKFLIGTLLLISSLHWGLILLYNSICINISVWGFVTNIISMGSPMCIMINEVQYSLSKYFITIMAGVATSIITWITLNAPWNRNMGDEEHEHGD